MSKTKNFKAREEMWQALRIAYKALYKASDADVDAKTLSTISDAIDTVGAAIMSEREIAMKREHAKERAKELAQKEKEREARMERWRVNEEALVQALSGLRHPLAGLTEAQRYQAQVVRFYGASRRRSRFFEDT